MKKLIEEFKSNKPIADNTLNSNIYSALSSNINNKRK